jgi:hypothetical protein
MVDLQFAGAGITVSSDLSAELVVLGVAKVAPCNVRDVELAAVIK